MPEQRTHCASFRLRIPGRYNKGELVMVRREWKFDYTSQPASWLKLPKQRLTGTLKDWSGGGTRRMRFFPLSARKA
jgi:hypothetical protein